MFIPRPKQQEVLDFRGGKMGVSAVPGSGKTQTLSYLAAEIIASGVLDDDQEVLVVTLVNSAVDNFANRVGSFVKERGLLPQLGYRVRTLHGLAHDIVRERPDLAGLSDDFHIVDERAADQIREDAALAWLRANPYTLEDYLNPDVDENKVMWVRREPLPDLVNSVASSFIRYAKDLQLTPPLLRQRLDGLPLPLPLAEMGYAIFADYQRALLYRGAVDFDDLIRLALQVLELERDYLERLRSRWPFILEDEAQDSSRLQESILRLLCAEDGNWVRVGDPNQAIFETFTTASPQFLRDFLQEPGVQAREMPNSGRSTFSIIRLANDLIDWTQQEHPVEGVRGALSLPYIEPAPVGDPQPNPPDAPRMIHFFKKKLSPQEEIQTVVRSLARWLPDHPQETVAVLVPRNQRGFELVSELERRKLAYSDSLLRSTTSTRAAAGALGDVVDCLADPGSSKKLSTAYKAWRRARHEDEGAEGRVEQVVELLRKCHQVEEYLWPWPDGDWLESLGLPEDADLYSELLEFRQYMQRWQGTALLPVDQIILTLAQDLFSEPADLAIAHKLAVILRQASQAHLDWRLPELTEELGIIARNERRFLGFSEDDTAFDPERHKGKVVVATMHKAKGLEWDRVYLMSVNDYDFPSGLVSDRYLSEPWFIRDHLNLEAEALSQLEAANSSDEYAWYEEGAPSRKARLDYVAERLRLLYVAITRAKKELIVTWNTGRDGKRQPAQPFLALLDYWEKNLSGEEPDAPSE